MARRLAIAPLVWIPAALALLGAPRPARAQVRGQTATASVSASLSSNRAQVGDSLTLTIRVRIEGQAQYRGGGFFRRVTAPSHDYHKPRNLEQDFVVVRTIPFEFNQTVNNWQTYTAEYKYTIRPRRTGRLTVGAARVVYKGRTYRSRVLTVQVGTGPTPPPALPGKVPKLTGDEDLWVHVVPDKLTAYVGEQITVTWYLYYKSPVARQAAILTRPSTDNFFSEEIPFRQRNSTHTTINGVVYTVTPVLRRALFPLKAGKLRIGRLTIEAYLDLFQQRSSRHSSAEVDIQAKPLPAQGRPPGFHGSNVGRFRVSARVDHTQLDARSATSLKVTVSGTGFLHGLKVDKLTQLDGFKVRFAGQQTEASSGVRLGGKRIHEYVLIPARVGTLTVAPICFPHFDPAVGRYVTNACSRPIQMQVTGTLPASAGPAGGGGQDNLLRRRLKPILQATTLADHKPWRLHRTRWLLWLLLLLPVLALLGMVLARQIRSTLSQDTESRRRRQARGHARRRLKLAQSYLRDSDRVGFFTEIANVIHELLSARLGVRVQGLTTAELQQILEQSGLSAALQEKLIRDLEVCDFARFAPAASDQTEMQEVLGRTRKLIAEIERARIGGPNGPGNGQDKEATS